MIATHNIKVNGVWYHAGDAMPETKAVQMELLESIPEVPHEEAKAPEAIETAPEEKPEPAKPKSTRRNKTSE